MARGTLLGAVGAAAVVAMLTLTYHFYAIDGAGWGLFMTGFGYSLDAMAFALLVAAALSPQARALRWRIPGTRALALWSYSTYLSHKPLAYVIAQQFRQRGWPDDGRLPAIALACIAMGGLLYVLVEAPFMAWRDRLVPTNFRDALQPAPPQAVLTSGRGASS
jgi:peptidoglycan/LPS O-acetylase OafA/YrhL